MANIFFDCGCAVLGEEWRKPDLAHVRANAISGRIQFLNGHGQGVRESPDLVVEDGPLLVFYLRKRRLADWHAQDFEPGNQIHVRDFWSRSPAKPPNRRAYDIGPLGLFDLCGCAFQLSSELEDKQYVESSPRFLPEWKISKVC